MYEMHTDRISKILQTELRRDMPKQDDIKASGETEAD